jgi:hypothetical protein
MWFSGGQEFMFLSSPLSLSLSCSKNSFEIKHSTTELVMSNPLSFSRSNTRIFGRETKLEETGVKNSFFFLQKIVFFGPSVKNNIKRQKRVILYCMILREFMVV